MEENFEWMKNANERNERKKTPKEIKEKCDWTKNKNESFKQNFREKVINMVYKSQKWSIKVIWRL